jgi:hypothetical protein
MINKRSESEHNFNEDKSADIPNFIKLPRSKYKKRNFYI